MNNKLWIGQYVDDGKYFIKISKLPPIEYEKRALQGWGCPRKERIYDVVISLDVADGMQSRLGSNYTWNVYEHWSDILTELKRNLLNMEYKANAMLQKNEEMSKIIQRLETSFEVER